MQLRRLEVENIRSFEHGRLDLGPGTTLLVGDVGAGKSSLLYAVEMALFGVAEVDAAFLIRHGTAHAEVAVTLGDDEHRFTVRRRFRKVHRRGRESFEPEKLTFVEDGHPTSYSATEIRQRVIEQLGFPDNPNPQAHSDLWRWAIYVPQERMREILATEPEERLETVRKALGVERYRIAADNAEALARDLRAGVRHRREESGRMAHWDAEFAQATAEADRLRADRIALTEAVRRANGDLEGARTRRTDAEAALGRLEADRREREGLRRTGSEDERAAVEAERRRAQVTAEAGSAQEEVARLQPLVAGRPRINEEHAAAQATTRARREALDRTSDALQQLARATAAQEASVRRLRETDDRVARATRDRAQLHARLDALQQETPREAPPLSTAKPLVELDRELLTARDAERAAVERLARARASVEQVSELLTAGICPTCGQAVRTAEFEGHRAEATTELDAAETQRGDGERHRQMLEEARGARERYDRDLQRWTELERQRREARGLLERADAEVASATEAASAASAEATELRAAVDRLAPVGNEAERLRRELDGAEAAERALADRERHLVAAEERLRALTALRERLDGELARLEAEQLDRRRRSEDRARRLSELDAVLAAETDLLRESAAARAEEERRERELAEARNALVRADTRLDGLVERVAAAERGRAERAALVAEANDLEAKAGWIAEPFRVAVLRMEKELLAHAQVAFDRAFGRFFASLIDDPTLVARTDGTFTPEVTIAGVATPAEALSGGERTSLALAFRLALATVVRSLGSVRLETLLLDEPTDGFSAEQVVRMGELLEELALPQVVLVSHESELAGVADRTVRVVKGDGRSTLETDAVASTGAPPSEAAAPEPATLAPARPGRRRTT